MYFKQTPRFLKSLYPRATWSSKEDSRLFLTFDDGPHPQSTPAILELLSTLNIKASFFCLGKNAENFPSLIEEIKTEGHQIGLHGYSHLSGWNTGLDQYLSDIKKSQDILKSDIFRPPYGRITPRQYYHILNQLNLDLVFWSHMPGDFDPRVSQKDFHWHLHKGWDQKDSVIVLHDKPSCLSKISYALSILSSEKTNQRNYLQLNSL